MHHLRASRSRLGVPAFLIASFAAGAAGAGIVAAASPLPDEMTSTLPPGPAPAASARRLAPDPLEGLLEHSRGSYAAGTLVNARQLPDAGAGYVKIFRPRDRAWGSHNLVALLQAVAAQVSRRFPEGERLQVADLGARGGGTITRHASHQNGLDVDVAPFRRDRREQDPAPYGEAGFDEVFVKDGAVSPNFDLERNWALVRALVGTGKINRIFIDESIKRALCAHARAAHGAPPAPDVTEALRRLRPYAGHDDHFHVRLKCPANSPRCQAQEEVPVGSGCDALARAAGDPGRD